ncbi:MAG TPA: lysophospholipid acyltransferase family protein [Candidatus Angelobacter sp.]
MLEPLIRGLITGGAKVLTAPQTRWLGCEPDDRPRIYYSNHTSHLDFVLLWSALPRPLRARTRPVAASDYWDRLSLRRYVIRRVFSGILIRRYKTEQERCLAPLFDALDHRQSLIVFPEGTRGRDQVLGPFKAGLFHMAQARPEIDLVPVWLTNCSQVLPKGSYLPLPLLCSVAFGPPQRIRPNEDKAGFLHRLRQSLLELEAA